MNDTRRNLPDVVPSCRRVVTRAQHVCIDGDALEAATARIDRDAVGFPVTPEALCFHGSRQAVANFVLLADCLNFCFWSDAPWVVPYAGREWTRTYAMLAGVVRGVCADAGWLRPQRWRDVDEPEVEALFAGTGRIPLLRERVRVLRETGTVLLDRYDGEFVNLIEDARHEAPAIARLLARDFPSFRDAAVFQGEPVAFLKRAQICAADLATCASLGGRGSHGGRGSLSGLDELTVFADYRLPQLFRHWGIMTTSDALAERIEAQVEIPSGSDEETELRAATIVIGDRLAHSLALPAWRLDHYLWERSHDPDVRVAHHRTRTIFY